MTLAAHGDARCTARATTARRSATALDRRLLVARTARAGTTLRLSADLLLYGLYAIRTITLLRVAEDILLEVLELLLDLLFAPRSWPNR